MGIKKKKEIQLTYLNNLQAYSGRIAHVEQSQDRTPWPFNHQQQRMQPPPPKKNTP